MAIVDQRVAPDVVALRLGSRRCTALVVSHADRPLVVEERGPRSMPLSSAAFTDSVFGLRRGQLGRRTPAAHHPTRRVVDPRTRCPSRRARDRLAVAGLRRRACRRSPCPPRRRSGDAVRRAVAAVDRVVAAVGAERVHPRRLPVTVARRRVRSPARPRRSSARCRSRPRLAVVERRRRA